MPMHEIEHIYIYIYISSPSPAAYPRREMVTIGGATERGKMSAQSLDVIYMEKYVRSAQMLEVPQ